MNRKHSVKNKRKVNSSWGKGAKWYSGWVGDTGSIYHTNIAFPKVLSELNLKKNSVLLDIGCGIGVFSKYVSECGVKYVGIDVSEEMITIAKEKFFEYGTFEALDARNISKKSDLKKESFDYATFILSIQDMPDLDIILKNVSFVLKPKGKLVIFLKHPAFNIPRQSGYILDEKRKIYSRRVDTYLTDKCIPLDSKDKNIRFKTYHFHRPISSYVNTLVKYGFKINSFEEIKDSVSDKKDKIQSDFPMFMLLSVSKA